MVEFLLSGYGEAPFRPLQRVLDEFGGGLENSSAVNKRGNPSNLQGLQVWWHSRGNDW